MASNEVSTIRVKVDDPQQLFNSVDPSPFHERDLDPGCAEFIMSWARELPRHDALRLEIVVSASHAGSSILGEIPTAVRNHFAREADLQRLRVRRLFREGRTSLALGLAIMTVCTTIAAFLPGAVPEAVGEILGEGLVIAGWVAMWHPVHTLLYGYWPVIRERRLFDRLAQADIDVEASGPERQAHLGGVGAAEPSVGTKRAQGLL